MDFLTAVGCGSRAELVNITRAAIDMFLLSKQDSGQIGGIGYWQNANGYTAIALHDLWSGSQHYRSVVEDALMKVEAQQHNFINEFNDDSMWWAMCSIAAYQAYGNELHLHRARRIQSHVRRSVVRKGEFSVHDMDMEGAVFWTTKKEEQNLNSITTGLYSELTAELTRIQLANSGSQTLKSPSKRVWGSLQERIKGALVPQEDSKTVDLESSIASCGWIRRCRLSDNIVKDTIRVRDKELIDWIFTYNTGQAIGACTAIARASSGDTAMQCRYLDLACGLAQKAMQYMHWNIDGVLTEYHAYGPDNHDPYKNDDSVGFKSIMLRHLAKLWETIQESSHSNSSFILDTARLIRDYVNKIFMSLRRYNVNDVHQYGPWWSK
ncbi:MAG: hypothetical protein Q9227_008851 [Pyrenula ochraceoflavens]